MVCLNYNYPPETYTFEISGIGYQTLYQTVSLIQNTTLTIPLQQDVQLQEITVTSNKLNKTATITSSGITSITGAAVERLRFLGEKDK